jgi:hypothetical protein
LLQSLEGQIRSCEVKLCKCQDTTDWLLPSTVGMRKLLLGCEISLPTSISSNCAYLCSGDPGYNKF